SGSPLTGQIFCFSASALSSVESEAKFALILAGSVASPLSACGLAGTDCCGGASNGPSDAFDSAFGAATGFGLQPKTPIIRAHAKMVLSRYVLVIVLFPSTFLWY